MSFCFCFSFLRDKRRVSFAFFRLAVLPAIDYKTVGFFFPQNRFSLALESHTREVREPHTPVRRVRREKKSVFRQSRSPFSPSLQTFCLIVRKYLNTQKGGLFWSLCQLRIWQVLLISNNKACLIWLIKGPSFSWSTNISSVTGPKCHALEAT